MNFYNWAEKGWLRPIVGKTFKLMEAPKAHKEILESCAKGKLVLEIDWYIFFKYENMKQLLKTINVIVKNYY